MTRIGEQPEFATLAQVAANHVGVPRMMIEKDYWVTETLRELARAHPDEFVFKGGTSLSKCFEIINRFSEDIDILLTDALPTRGARDRAMKSMVKTVTTAMPLTADLRRSDRGISRDVDLSWPRHGSDAGGTLTGIAPTIRLEMGMRGSHLPSMDRSVTSLLVTALTQIDPSAAAEFIPAHDHTPFAVPTLHPGRTLVEKLLLLLSHAERLTKGEVTTIPARQGRHIYDVIQLLGSAIVCEFLDDRSMFLAAVEHAQRVSTEHWGTTTMRPPDGFATSVLVSGGAIVDDALKAAYATDVPGMLIGDEPPPSIHELAARIAELGDRL